MKPQLATANGLASRQGNGVGQQTRTAQATSGGQKKVSSTKSYQGASTTPITVGGQTVNVFVSLLLLPMYPVTKLPALYTSILLVVRRTLCSVSQTNRYLASSQTLESTT